MQDETQNDLKDFLQKTQMSTEACACVGSNVGEAEILEREILKNNFQILENVLEIGEKLETENNKIAIPVFRMDSVEDIKNIYELVLGYATGQIILNIDNVGENVQEHKTVRFNHTTKNNSLVLIFTDEFLRKSNFNWLEIVGITFRIV